MEELNFVHVDCHYNPNRDISPVNPEGVINLKDAFVNGLIPADVAVGDSEYDNNDNPRSIIGRPANEFEAIHMRETLVNLATSESKGSEN